tara:strand:+ start:2553 stop:3911 length:1359 start_codon:yes stop_codon:yes gene_type:complete
MEDEPEEKFEQVSVFHLIGNMLSPRTLPHIVMIALISMILLFLVDSHEVFVAMAFLSLAIAYTMIAGLSNLEIIKKLTKLPEEKNDSPWLVRFLFSFRITIVPILISIILVGLFWEPLGGNGNTWISPMLASLFIVWSLTQAISFRTGMVEWLANGLGDAKLHTYKEKTSTATQFIIVQTFAFVIIWLGQVITDSEKMTAQDAFIGGIIFLLASTLLQMLTLWLTRDERESAGSEKGLAKFSFKWMIIAQLFITWHAFSIYRRWFMNPSEVSTMIEEGILMAFTVIFAVWSLTSFTVKDGKRLVSENASLPLGISFGYAYAGSVTMLTGTFESLKEVMIFGHFITICAMIFLLRPTLRASRVSADMFVILKENSESEDDDKENTSKEENNEDPDVTEESDEKEWQEDEEVNWKEGVDISEGTEWEDDNIDVEDSESEEETDSDVELVDSDEA